jgi:serine/threonine protein kinase
MAPELYTDNPDYSDKVDQFSLGILIFYLWTGSFFYNKKKISYWIFRSDGQPASFELEGADTELNELFKALVSVNQNDRPDSATLAKHVR